MEKRIPLLGMLLAVVLMCTSCASHESKGTEGDVRLFRSPTVNPATGAKAPEVAYLEVTPERIIDASYKGSVTLTFNFNTQVSSAEVQLINGSMVPLARIGDFLWTRQFNNDDILRGYVKGEPHVFMGYCNTYNGGSRLIQYNLFLPVKSNQMPVPETISLGKNAQMSDHVLNLRHDTLFLGGTTSTFATVWNAVQDEVKAAIGYRDFYALVGQVHAYANRTGGGSVFCFPIPSLFDLANQATVHELGHCLGLARSNHPLLAGKGNHWALGNAANAIMGWGLPQGVSFPYRLEPGDIPGTTKIISISSGKVFNDLELYKMGLISGRDVEPILQFSNQDTAAHWMINPYSLPSCGPGCQVLDVPSQYITIDDIIAADGVMSPANKTSFTIGAVVLSHERLLTASEMAYYEYMAARGEGVEPVHAWEGFASYESKPFNLATRGLMTITTRLKGSDTMGLVSGFSQAYLPIPLKANGYSRRLWDPLRGPALQLSSSR